LRTSTGLQARGDTARRALASWCLGARPLQALTTEPRFHRQWWIDLDGDKVARLLGLPEVQARPEVEVITGDANRVLLDQVFPNLRYEDYWRGLCVLDPYGLHLDWSVIEKAGRMRSIELFINFPIMDVNRNALWREANQVSTEAVARMTAFWGGDSWKRAAYAQQPGLFGDLRDVKLGNREVVDAFRERLRTVAGFAHVPDPMPMRNSSNAVVYYLFFASQNAVGRRIAEGIMKRYRSRGGG
jgi:three-Cys-motif partner protein